MNTNINRIKVVLVMISVIAILTYSYTGVVLADDINVETRPICKTIMSKIDDKVPYEDWNQEEQKECWSCLEEKLKKAILAKGPDSSSKTRYGETLYQDKKKKKEKDRKQNIRNKIRTFTKVIKKIDENLPFEVWNPEEQGIYLKTKLTTDLEDTVKNFKEQLASSKEELSNRIEGLADETRKNKDANEELRTELEKINPEGLTRIVTDKFNKKLEKKVESSEIKTIIEEEIEPINKRMTTLEADLGEKAKDENIVGTNTSAAPSQDLVSGKPETPSVDGANKSKQWILRDLNWLIPLLIILVIALAYILIRILNKQDDSRRGKNRGKFHGTPSTHMESHNVTQDEGFKRLDQTPSGQTIEISEADLINWWDENGNKDSNKFIRSFEMVFGKKFPFSVEGNSENWDLIFIWCRRNEPIVLPRKGAIYNDITKKWFRTDDKVKCRGNIVSLEKFALASNIYPYPMNEKGIVGIKEDKTRIEENQTVTSKQTEALYEKTKPKKTLFTEENLIDWWNKDGKKTFNECEDNIKEEFGDNVKIKAIDYNQSNKEEWYLMGILKNSSQKSCFVIPRKFYFTINIQKWFVAKDGSTSRDALIKSLNKLAKTHLETTPMVPTEKGEVTITTKE